MELDFVKLHGLGNDFVVIDDRSGVLELTDKQVTQLCDRHFGIGADGIILVRPSPDPACVAYMHYINADATLAQMCGNGVRCFAKYLIDRGFVSSQARELVVDTLSGPKPISLEVDDRGALTYATVDMGCPVLAPVLVPVAVEANATNLAGVAFVCELPIESPWGVFHFTCVSMGNPHAVCFVENWDSLADELFSIPSDKRLATLEVNRIGSYVEACEVFPEKTNVEFVAVSANGLAMRVYERGCGETLACGTGACAVQVAASLTGRAGCEGDVALRGGTLHIAWGEDDHVRMRGPAAESFSGKVVIV